MIFTPENVKLILQGRKTQTRRLIKPDQAVQMFEYPKNGHTYFGRGLIQHRCDPYSPYRLVYVIHRTYAVQPGRGKRAVCRIRITDMRVQRLQDISETDAMAEGVEPAWCAISDALVKACGATWRAMNHVSGFARLWEQLHGTGSWDENPWVVAYTFERVNHEAAKPRRATRRAK